MIDVVHTFRNGTVDIDPEVNVQLPIFSFNPDTPTRVLYNECGNCGKMAEQDLVASGPGICVIEYACGCTYRNENDVKTWEVNNKQG